MPVVEQYMSTFEPTSQSISDAPLPAVASPFAVEKPVASVAHTLGLLAILAGGAYFSVVRANHMRAQAAPHHLLYLPTLAMEWAWFGYVMLGIRMRGVPPRELIGPRWSSAKQVFTDIGIAIVFQLCALIVLGAIGALLHAGTAVDKIRYLAPDGPLELVMFTLLAASAGFCEEIIFRGYFQRQFISWTGNAVLGVLISAAIFGACHVYQSGKQAIVIGAYGALFGGLSLYRRSLKPGMIAHGLQDTCSGVLLLLLNKHIIPGM
jgi:membrane protease YdiL (CAAX protease family)